MLNDLCFNKSPIFGKLRAFIYKSLTFSIKLEIVSISIDNSFFEGKDFANLIKSDFENNFSISLKFLFAISYFLLFVNTLILIRS